MLCAVLSGNQLVIDPAPPADQSQCSLVVMSGSESAGITNLLLVPDSQALNEIWNIGFGLPAFMFLIAYLVGRVVRMFD